MTTQNDDAKAAKERKARYKKSLNLPKTSFPMRANLAQNEPQSRKRWNKEKLYQQILDARAEAAVFAFHDGPPYANGAIHTGHLLNKVLKDIVVRSRNLMGQRCHYVPGWDCHGLPIEHKVMTGLVESGKVAKLDTLDVNTRHMAIRRECAKYATKYQKLQRGQMEALLTLADYDNPYLTMTPDFEQATVEVFAGLVKQGLVYRDLKPVHWSIANQTALADAELEYQEREDPSIFVNFEAKDLGALAAAFGVEPSVLGDRGGFLIWTTTPWTLAANRLIAVHLKHTYALARLDAGDRGSWVSVVAKELLEKVAATGGAKAEVLAEVSGEALVGLTYKHPYGDDQVYEGGSGRLVEADYVTLDDGTGLVHTAPGHGVDDYQTGMREGEPVYCPVQGDGTYDDTVPEWLRGLTVWEANEKVVPYLRESGHLFHSESYPHSYPHDWRSKTPVIFRCTEQWFVAVDRPTSWDGKNLRELAFGAVDDEITFHPEWGAKRMRGMLESRPDWCISRQRSWGLPIPAFRRADGSVFLTAASAQAVAEAFGRHGSDAWFTKSPADLLEGYDPAADAEAPDDLDLNELQPMYDIFDVWFESGSSWNAVMRKRGIGFPTDLYLEGSDQHRGWFQLSLLPSLGVQGCSPFKNLLTHGFIVDKDGKKMSKSLGNTLDVEELLKSYGAEVCRWWVSSVPFENDIKVDLSYFDVAGESYRKVRNTLRFLLSNLADFSPDKAVDLTAIDPTSIDAFVLARTEELRERVVAAYGNFQFRQVHTLLFDFCNETLSSFYLDAVKDRLYCDRADSERRRRAQTVMHRIADVLVRFLAPLLPHTADEAWRALHGDGAGSVHVETFAAALASPVDSDWSKVLEVRDTALKALENAKADGIENRLDAGLVLPDGDGVLARFTADLPDTLGVSRVSLSANGNVEIRDLREEPRCERSWKRDETVRQREDGGFLSDRDAEAVGIQ